MENNTVRFLSKGGLILGLTATAHFKQQEQWNALGPALSHPAESFLHTLQQSEDVLALSAAVMHVTNGVVEWTAPAWVVDCISNEPILCQIGDTVSHCWPPDSDQEAAGGRPGGQSALAIALCRNMDISKAASLLFTVEEAALFWDMASVASVLAPPGVPSQIRRKIKALVKEARNDDGTTD